LSDGRFPSSGRAGVRIAFQDTVYLPTLIIFPLSIAYAILRYRLLGMTCWSAADWAMPSCGCQYRHLPPGSDSAGPDIERRPCPWAVPRCGPGGFDLAVRPYAIAHGAEHLAERLLGWRRFDYRGRCRPSAASWRRCPRSAGYSDPAARSDRAGQPFGTDPGLSVRLQNGSVHSATVQWFHRDTG